MAGQPQPWPPAGADAPAEQEQQQGQQQRERRKQQKQLQQQQAEQHDVDGRAAAHCKSSRRGDDEEGGARAGFQRPAVRAGGGLDPAST
jgi:hypothetical protein